MRHPEDIKLISVTHKFLTLTYHSQRIHVYRVAQKLKTTLYRQHYTASQTEHV